MKSQIDSFTYLINEDQKLYGLCFNDILRNNIFSSSFEILSTSTKLFSGFDDIYFFKYIILKVA